MSNSPQSEPSEEQLNRLAELYYAGKLKETEQLCRELLRSHSDTLVVIDLLGAVLRGRGKLKEALQIFNQSIEINPNSEAYNRRSAVFTELGMIKEAIRDYEHALELEPNNAVIHRNLAELKTYKTDDEQLKLMQECYSDSDTDERQRIHLCFALAKAHDDLNDFDNSFRYLTEGNRLHKKRLGYDICDDERLVHKIKRLFRSSTALPVVTDNKPRSKQPVFIIGMPRTGTSLVEQILASHSCIHGAGELDFMRRLVEPILSKTDDKLLQKDIMPLRSGYLDMLNALDTDNNIIIDKMPFNFMLLGFILVALPEARIIHVRRHPVATGWSLYRHYFPARGHGYAYDLADIATFHNLYMELMNFWCERFPKTFHELIYEELVNNQEVETRKLLSFCNLEWEEECLEFHKTERPVQTASAMQVRKPIYTGSSDAWKSYRQYLEPLITGLHD